MKKIIWVIIVVILLIMSTWMNSERCHQKEDTEHRQLINDLCKEAEQGDIQTQYVLGCYFFAQNTLKNRTEAIKWWHKAAEQEHWQAQYHLGICYLLGEGVPKNQKEGKRWLQKAAKQGHLIAQDVLDNYTEPIQRSYDDPRKIVHRPHLPVSSAWSHKGDNN